MLSDGPCIAHLQVSLESVQCNENDLACLHELAEQPCWRGKEVGVYIGVEKPCYNDTE